MQYKWKYGIVEESRPSVSHWCMSLLLYVTVVWSLLYTIDWGGMTGIYARLVETWLAEGLKIWFSFRISFFSFRFSSSWWYHKVKYPSLRKKMEEFKPYGSFAVLYTAYEKTPVEIELALTGLYKACWEYGAQKTIVFMAMNKGKKGKKELALLDSVREAMIRNAGSGEEATFYENMILTGEPQDGSGKRSALAQMIDFVASSKIGGADLYYMMDGDSIPAPDAFCKAAPIFQNYPEVGGVTLENAAYVQGGEFYAIHSILRFFKRTFDLFATTVMTGRGSLIRGEILESKGASKKLKSHFIRWGWIWKRFIKAKTGDDKTVLEIVYQQGYETKFAPDAMVYAMEEPLEFNNKWVDAILKWSPVYSFVREFRSILKQEVRYTTNMLLLGASIWQVRPKSLSVTLKLLDQRLFYWSAMVGPITAITTAVHYGHMDILLFWLLSSLLLRTVMTLVQGLIFRGYWHPLMPFISFMNVLQAVVKTLAYYNIEKSNWPRGAGGERARSWVWPTVHIGTIIAVAKLSLVL